jgi:hypothetical protein
MTKMKLVDISKRDVLKELGSLQNAEKVTSVQFGSGSADQGSNIAYFSPGGQL